MNQDFVQWHVLAEWVVKLRCPEARGVFDIKATTRLSKRTFSGWIKQTPLLSSYANEQIKDEQLLLFWYESCVITQVNFSTWCRCLPYGYCVRTHLNSSKFLGYQYWLCIQLSCLSASHYGLVTDKPQ